MDKRSIQVNAMGDTCPIPIVKAKNAIKELAGYGEVEVLVDNEIAVQNLTKMANQKGYGVKAEKLGLQEYKVLITVGAEAEEPMQQKSGQPNAAMEVKTQSCCIQENPGKNIVIAIASIKMGEGDEIAGNRLMKSFLYSLSQQEILPSAILFYNSGAVLTCEGSPVLEELETLEAQGIELLSCGTCLEFYGVAEALRVGSATNMYTLTEKMMQADLVIRP